jgi:hypothetical protein
MEDIYYEKYIKYKTKYLELKELNGGGNWFLSKEDIYGRYYAEFDLIIKKIKVIKEIKEVIGINCIKEMMKINTVEPNIDIFFEFSEHYKKSLNKYFEDKNKPIECEKKIKKSNNIIIKDIINVLEDIEDILIFNTYPPSLILPELYVNFSEKLDTFKNKPIEEYKKKNKKILEAKLKTETNKQYKEIEDEFALTRKKEKEKRREELIEEINKQIENMIDENDKKIFTENREQIADVKLNAEYASKKKINEKEQKDKELSIEKDEIKKQLTKAQKLQLELLLGNKENDDYKQNIDSIKNIYFIFCDIKNEYQKYYNNFYSNINNYNDYYSQKQINNQHLKDTINKKNEKYKNDLKMYLNLIKPKVPLLLDAIELYFYFLKYYIDNDIKPYTSFTNTSIINKPFRSDPYIEDQESFIFNIGMPKSRTRGKMIDKIFERYLYSDEYLYRNEYLNSKTYLQSDTILDLFNKINSLTNSNFLTNFEYVKILLIKLLERTKNNILELISKNEGINGYLPQFKIKFGSIEENPIDNIDNIIITIEKNYNDIESNNGITWEMYHKEYQNKIDNYLMFKDFNFPFLKKCINIYLYKIFNYISRNNKN